jgi:preprotein translocase subunit SecY
VSDNAEFLIHAGLLLVLLAAFGVMWAATGVSPADMARALWLVLAA